MKSSGKPTSGFSLILRILHVRRDFDAEFDDERESDPNLEQSS